MATIRRRGLGSSGPEVAALGLGCMGMSGMYGPAEREESIATIRAALDAGVDLLDTGDFYGMGHNELLIGEALRGRPREGCLLSVKFGAQRGPDGAWLGYDASPAAVKTALAYTLSRLGVEHIDVYRPARLDPKVPIEETIGAIAELVDAGYVRHIGLSEVGPETIRRGHLSPDRELAASDFRARAPRFAKENRERNLALVEALREIADAAGVTVAQVAIAWVLDRGDDIVALVGARTRERLAEALGALSAHLDPDDVAALERAVPPDAAAGDRYPQAQMAVLDSERA